MEKCSQCESVAIERYNGFPLCLGCLERLSNIHYKQEEARHREIIYAMQMANAAEADRNAVLGLPSEPPVFDVSVFKQGHKMQVSNISVSNSVVGNISTAEVGNINVNLENLSASGRENLAQHIESFTKAILKTQDISVEKKNELLEQVSLLSDQAVIPPPQRKQGIVKAALAGIKEGASVVSHLADTWKRIEPLITDYFSS